MDKCVRKSLGLKAIKLKLKRASWNYNIKMFQSRSKLNEHIATQH